MLGTAFVKFVMPILAVIPLSAAVALFADAPAEKPATAQQVELNSRKADTAQATGLIAICGTAVTGLFLWLARREDTNKESIRLQYDRRVALIESKVEMQAAEVVRLTAAEVACQLREKKLQDQLAQQELELQQDRYEIADLRWRLDNRPGEHPALPPGADRRRPNPPPYHGDERRNSQPADRPTDAAG